MVKIAHSQDNNFRRSWQEAHFHPVATSLRARTEDCLASNSEQMSRPLKARITNDLCLLEETNENTIPSPVGLFL